MVAWAPGRDQARAIRAAETGVVGNKAAGPVRQTRKLENRLMKRPHSGNISDSERSRTNLTKYPMPTHETISATSPVNDGFHNYLVIAADMATYSGDSIDGCQLVMTSAESQDDALGTALTALDDGFIPVAAFAADELHQLADQLAARALKPAESYNLSSDITDAEMAEQNREDDLQPEEV